MLSDPAFESTSCSGRASDRSNTFLMAMVVSNTLAAPVRIRNLSSSGALLAGKELPRLGETCRIRRGELSVGGRIVRVAEKGVGMEFNRAVDVDMWMRAGQERQSEVDRRVEQARHRYPVADSRHLARLAERPAALGARHTSVSTLELIDLADRLDWLANAISDEPAMIAKLSAHLQILDVAPQRLRALCSEILSGSH